MTSIPRTLGRWDLVLLKIVAIVNINNVPAVAVYGRMSLALWILAFVCFFVPEAIAVVTLSRRYPGEGGIYLWTRRAFGDAHGFLSGWCYWTNNLFYVPVLLVYMAGIFAFAGGEARAAGLVNLRIFVAGVSLAWLAFITLVNVRGMAAGKWIQNVGGLSAFGSVALVIAAAVAAWAGGAAAPVPASTPFSWEMATSFAVMCNALVGIELASAMGDEIRDPDRDLGPAIAIAGAVSIGSYLLVTVAVLMLVPVDRLGVIQGVMQAVSAGAHAVGIGWIIVPLAIVMGLATGGAASAWFAGSSRIPFVAGLSHALPPALGRMHPRWQSPHVALITCAVLTALFTAFSLAGSSVAEAYQVLLKAAVVIQLVPFVYLFLALANTVGAGPMARIAGLVGLVTTGVSLVAAFLPTSDVASVAVFESKLAVGVVGPTAVGWFLYKRSAWLSPREGDRMRRMRTSLCLLIAALALASGRGAAQTPATPVLVELFTSEGCRDCPPADTVLQNLIDTSPVGGVQVIGLGQHVDYWDRLGWKDRFSSAALTDRQRVYATRFASESIYTPQMVVDGTAEFVGSDASAARKAIERAVKTPRGAVKIEVQAGAANRVPVTVVVRDLPSLDRGDHADILLAVTEDGLRSSVTRGENNGKLLRHAAVVRSMTTIGEAAATGGEARAEIPIASDWRRDNLKVVAFVQARKGRAVLASAAVPLTTQAR